jgi:phosphoserine phosphatase
MSRDGRIRLVAFDLDGTLLRGDTVCTSIARSIGTLERMQEMERGHELADRLSDAAEMASWYLPLGRKRIESELSRLTPAPGADQGCSLLREAGVGLVIISVTWKFAVQHFAERFGASDYAATPLDWTTGEFDDFDAEHKGPWLEAKIASLGLSADQVAAVGDSPNDHGMFEAAGTSFCVATACGEIDNVIHRPDANILELAKEILAL